MSFGAASAASFAKFRDDVPKLLLDFFPSSPRSTPPVSQQEEELARLVCLVVGSSGFVEAGKFEFTKSGNYVNHASRVARRYTRAPKALSNNANKEILASFFNLPALGASITASIIGLARKKLSTRYDLYAILGFTEDERMAIDDAMDDSAEIRVFANAFKDAIVREPPANIQALAEGNMKIALDVARKIRRDVRCSLQEMFENKKRMVESVWSSSRC